MEKRITQNKIEMPDSYYISYMTEKEKGIMTHLIKAKDEKGNIYYQVGNKKRWFAKKNAAYRSFFLEDNGRVVLEEDKDFTDAYVYEVTKEFQRCTDKSLLQRIGKAEYQENCCVAGRECEEYTVTVKAAVFSQCFSCMVDKQTGICLKWQQKANLNGFEIHPGGNFECIEFLTNQVSERLARKQPEEDIWEKLL